VGKGNNGHLGRRATSCLCSRRGLPSDRSRGRPLDDGLHEELRARLARVLHGAWINDGASRREPLLCVRVRWSSPPSTTRDASGCLLVGRRQPAMSVHKRHHAPGLPRLRGAENLGSRRVGSRRGAHPLKHRLSRDAQGC
jgi:hypothetical protein